MLFYGPDQCCPGYIHIASVVALLVYLQAQKPVKCGIVGAYLPFTLISLGKLNPISLNLILFSGTGGIRTHDKCWYAKPVQLTTVPQPHKSPP